MRNSLGVDGTSSPEVWPSSWANDRLRCCYECREVVIDAFFDLADAIITVCARIRRAWTTHRWDTPGTAHEDHQVARVS
jgi:hypothetical protein